MQKVGRARPQSRQDRGPPGSYFSVWGPLLGRAEHILEAGGGTRAEQHVTGPRACPGDPSVWWQEVREGKAGVLEGAAAQGW